METICGYDCSECTKKDTCKGCSATNGHPFGGKCILAECCNNRICNNRDKLIGDYKNKLIKEFNDLNIKDMPKVTDLYPLNGFFINLEYRLNNQNIRFWNDNGIYLGNQLEKINSSKCFGLTANDEYLLVCEYEKDGLNPDIVLFKKR